jgi:hypothetical protein
MMLFPYRREPETGSRIPSISTGGAAMKPMMNTEVAVRRRRDHQYAEPTDVKTVFGAGNPVAEATP